MAIFKYKARTSSGRLRQGVSVGLNESDVLSRLRQSDLEPLSVVDTTDSVDARFRRFIAPIKTKELVIFTRQLAVMITANVTVVEALRILVDQTKNITLQNMIAEVAFEVDGGLPLSEAFAKRPKIFSNFFVNIIKSGETSGKLDEVLTYLADDMEQSYDMASKIKGAMIYPAFIIVGLLAVGIILMVYVIPNLTEILAEADAELPMATKAIIATSHFLQKYLWLVGLGVIILIIFISYAMKTKAGRWIIDKAKLNLPIFGELFQYIYVMRFTRSLSTLVKGGVTITRSLEIVSDVVGNEVYKKIIDDTIKSVQDGNPIATVITKSKDIPKMVSQMLSVGEHTGKLGLVLDKVTEFYERESDNMLSNLSKLMEPIIMVVMGAGVGIMVAAVIMPMYNLAGQF